jgi:hypothetical protein
MRTFLTEKLLAKIMGWTPEEISRELPLIQALAGFKYDEYQQFSPGIRFIESLAKWLEQFTPFDERKLAYDFIKNSLVFISNDQISHLVNITFTDKVNPILIEKTAFRKNVSKYLVNQIIGSPEYKELLRRSLFIGLSDGARIDLFRRSKMEISNEQVFPSYYIEADKSDDMIEKLNEEYSGKKFNSVFLIDDFTASGKSYFRQNENAYKGKIYKFLYKHLAKESSLIDLTDGLSLHVIFYVATREALDNINRAIQAYIKSLELDITVDVNAIQIIDTLIKETVLKNTDFLNLISKENKYFDKSIVDKHFEEGKSDDPHLGFNECALPLVLSHNTPNNSLPIFWFPEGSKVIGLFPRVTRHKE